MAPLKATVEKVQKLEFLIADSSSSRKSIRTLLSQIGVKAHQVSVAADPQSVRSMLTSKPTHVIFADYGFMGPETFKLLEFHQQQSPAPRSFFLLTSQESASLTSRAADAGVDAVLNKPFNFGDLQSGVLNALQRKLSPTKAQSLLDSSKAMLQAQKFKEALDILDQDPSLTTSGPLFYAYRGNALKGLSDLASARSAFEKGLAIQASHYRCLMGLWEVLMEEKNHEKAYEVGRTLATHHVVPPRRLPDFVRLSVVNAKYEDILGFYEAADRLNTEDELLTTYMAAGLVVCGLYFLKLQDSAKALSAFKKAESVSNGRPKILERILVALISAGLDNEMRPFLDKAPDDVKNSPELELARVERYLTQGNREQAMRLCMQLVQKKTPIPRIFHIAIELSIEAKRNKASVHDLIQVAMGLFGSQKDDFSKYLSYAGRGTDN